MRGDLLALGAVGVLVSLSEHKRWRDIAVGQIAPGGGILLDSLEGGLEEAPAVLEEAGEALALGSLARRGSGAEVEGRLVDEKYQNAMLVYLEDRVVTLGSKSRGWKPVWERSLGRGVGPLQFSNSRLREVLVVEILHRPTSHLNIWRRILVDYGPDTGMRRMANIALTRHLLGGTWTFWTGYTWVDSSNLWKALDPYLACLEEGRPTTQIADPRALPCEAVTDASFGGKATSAEYRRDMIFLIWHSPRYGWRLDRAPGNGNRLRFRHPDLSGEAFPSHHPGMDEEVLDIELFQVAVGISLMSVSRGARDEDGVLKFKSLLVVLAQNLLGGMWTLWSGNEAVDVDRLWAVLDPYLTCLLERREFSQIPEPKLWRIP